MRGSPQSNRPPESPLANFGNVSGKAGRGVARSVRVAANVKAMEMQVGRRPVYGGAPQHPPKIAANATTRGVQGSCGPLVGGRRIETAGRGA